MGSRRRIFTKGQSKIDFRARYIGCSKISSKFPKQVQQWRREWHLVREIKNDNIKSGKFSLELNRQNREENENVGLKIIQGQTPDV